VPEGATATTDRARPRSASSSASRPARRSHGERGGLALAGQVDREDVDVRSEPWLQAGPVALAAAEPVQQQQGRRVAGAHRGQQVRPWGMGGACRAL
jgi:hypothetical protein